MMFQLSTAFVASFVATLGQMDDAELASFEVEGSPREGSQATTLLQASSNGYEWDHHTIINESCIEIWPFIADYGRLISITLPFTDPYYELGEPYKVPSVVAYELQDLQIDECISVSNEEELYLSYALTKGFDLFSAYRGEWYLNDIDENSCQVHRGSMFLINPDGELTGQQYEKLVQEEIALFKEFFMQGHHLDKPEL